MELLSPEKMNLSKLRTEEEQVARIKKMNIEESESVKRLNTALAMEEEVRGRAIQVATEAEKMATQARKDAQNALGEVRSLEARRRAAIEPLTKREKELDRREGGINEVGEHASKRFADAVEKNKQADTRLSLVKATEDALEARSSQMDSREVIVLEKERHARELIERSTLDAEATRANADRLMAAAESRMVDANMVQAANDATRIQLESDQKAVNAERIGIQDGYRNLEAARVRILGRTT